MHSYDAAHLSARRVVWSRRDDLIPEDLVEHPYIAPPVAASDKGELFAPVLFEIQMRYDFEIRELFRCMARVVRYESTHGGDLRCHSSTDGGDAGISCPLLKNTFADRY